MYALHQGELSVGDCLLPRRVFRLIGLICDSLVRETGQRTRQRRVAIALRRLTESIKAANQTAFELPAGGGNRVELVQSANGICMVARRA